MKNFLFWFIVFLISFLLLFERCSSAELYDFNVIFIDKQLDYKFEVSPIIKQEKNNIVDYDYALKALEILNYDVMAVKTKIPLSKLPGNTKIGIIKEKSNCSDGSCTKPTSNKNKSSYNNNGRIFPLFPIFRR